MTCPYGFRCEPEQNEENRRDYIVEPKCRPGLKTGVEYVSKRWPSGKLLSPGRQTFPQGTMAPSHGLTEEFAAGCDFKLLFQQSAP
jgi:hypothetical protein